MVRLSFILFVFISGLNAAEFPAVKSATDQKFLKQYCFECHGAKKVKGKIDFRDITFAEDSQEWTDVLNQLKDGEMPPEDETQPSAEEKKLFTEWVKNELLKSFKETNKTQLRLMSINEYAATVRDLFAYDKEDFNPSNNLFNNADDRYDTIAKKQNVTSYTIDSYFKVADILVNRYVRDQWQKPRPQIWNITNKHLNTYKWNSAKNDKYVSVRSAHATKLSLGKSGESKLSKGKPLSSVKNVTGSAKSNSGMQDLPNNMLLYINES